MQHSRTIARENKNPPALVWGHAGGDQTKSVAGFRSHDTITIVQTG
jgi:hypothetical protein